mmetsp:Transcript_4992/g.9504  ORF Transcript_4992/g.9504 Transcript_4992/m.9504 type:complete len:366 (-) Transcript_4992:82-1179(-)
MTSSLSATNDTTTTTTTPTTPVTVSTTEELLLPLEWTRIQRRPRSSKQQKQKYNKSNSNYDDDETQDENLDACCDDGFCWNRRDANLQYSTTSAVTTTSTSTATTATKRKHPSGHDGKDMESKNGDALNSILKGKALFCLHSLDCSWFQGQFIINDSNSKLPSTTRNDNDDDLLHPRSRHHHSLQDDAVKSLGLLAKRRSDIDDCLKCSDGGYSEIDLTVLGRRTHDNDDHVDEIYPKKVGEHEMMRRSMTIKRLICTGGDMLCIRNSSFVTTTTTSCSRNSSSSSSSSSDSDVIVSFDAEQIITGEGKVDYLTRKYFPNLLSPSIGISNDDGPCVLTQYPDCAIVVGNMSLSLPKTFLFGKNSG